MFVTPLLSVTETSLLLPQILSVQAYFDVTNCFSGQIKEYERVLIFYNSEIFQDTAFFKKLLLALDIYEPKTLPRVTVHNPIIRHD